MRHASTAWGIGAVAALAVLAGLAGCGGSPAHRAAPPRTTTSGPTTTTSNAASGTTSSTAPTTTTTTTLPPTTTTTKAPVHFAPPPPPSPAPAAPPVGPTIASDGFSPNSNGFSFANYGPTLSNGTVPTNLTSADLVTMFGPGVCADPSCDLIPEAQAWLNATNAAMSSGHCFGIAVLAALIWQAKLSAANFGAATTPQLNINANPLLQRQIAMDFAYQLLPSVRGGIVGGTPNQVLGALEGVLRPNPAQTYTIVIVKRDGSAAHAITPIGVRNDGNGTYEVLVYDNNWPDTIRSVLIDTNTDTWSYYATTQPNDPSATYEGDANTRSISLYPNDLGLGTQPCPFCGTVAGSGPRANAVAGGEQESQIYLFGNAVHHSDLIATNQAGQRLGYIHGKLVDDIPGGRVAPAVVDNTQPNSSVPDWSVDSIPHLIVPAGVPYTVTVDGSTLQKSDNETIGVIGPNFDLRISHIVVHPGDVDTLLLHPNGAEAVYTAASKSPVTLDLGVTDQHADYEFVLTGSKSAPVQGVTWSLPRNGGLLRLYHASNTERFNLTVTKTTPAGPAEFHKGGVVVPVNGALNVHFGGWNGPGSPGTGSDLPVDAGSGAVA